MKKLSLVALLAILSACKSQDPEGEAIRAVVKLEPSVSATCVLFEVRDPASHEVLKNDWVPRTSDQLTIAILRGALPAQVELAARPYVDGSCEEGKEVTPNGTFETVVASFGKGVTPAGELMLRPGTDGDGDKYVDASSGGADCKDQDGAVNPGVLEVCSDQSDLNCDNKKGCEGSTCGATACIGPPTAIALTLPTGQVTAGTCKSGTLQVKDANGANARVSATTPIGLQGAPAAGIAFFSDASCSTPATSVSLNANEGGASFSFQGKAAGTVAVTASGSGLTSATQNVEIVPGPGNRLVFTTPQRTAVAGVCSQIVTVQSQDAQGNPATVSTATAVTLSSSAATGFKFYSAPGCGAASEITSTTILAGLSSASFYFSGTKAEPVTVTLSGALTGSSQVETISAAPPTVIALSGAQAAQAGVCSAAVTATLQDSFGNPSNATSNTSISLSSGTAPFSFFTNSDCTGSITSATVAQGTNTATFYYRSNLAGPATLTGARTGFTSGTLAVTIAPGPATTLAFTTAQQTPVAGVCSTAATVQLRDALGNPVRVTVDTAVALSATLPDGFQFFSDQSCATAATSVNMLANTNSVSFYFKSTKAGSATLNVLMGTNITGSQPVNTSAAPPTVLAFPQSPLSVVAGVCTQITVQAQDGYGNPANVNSSQTVSLAASPSTNFNISSQTSCGNTVTSVSISASSNSATFYVRGTVTGSVSVTATRAGFTTGTLALTVTPAAPARLAFPNTAQTIEVNACSAATTVQVQDAFNNPSPVGVSTTVNLTAPPSGTITFYAGPGCTNPVTSITIAANTNSGSFFFKDSAVENPTIVAASSPLTNGTQQQFITPLQPTALVFTVLPTSVAAGSCSGTATVQAQAQGSPTTVTSVTPVDLAASPSTGFLFYSSTNCSGTAVTQVSIGSNQGNVSFSFKSTKAASVSLTASNPSITTPATQTITVTPAAPTKLVFTTSALQTVAGVCSAAVTVESWDANDNASPVTADKTLTLNQSGTPTDNNFKFYTNPNCTTLATGNLITLPNGQSSVSFYYKGEKARNVALAVSATGLTATPVQTHAVIAANASALLFSSSTPPGTLLAGTCAPRTVESWDAFNNPATNALTVTPGATGMAEFFSDASCTTPITTFNISAGNSSGSFYFKGLSGGINSTASMDLTASATGVTAAVQGETITPTVRTGTCVIADNSTNNTCTISPALASMDKTMLIFQTSTTNQDGATANVRCFLNSTSQVRCERGDNTGNDVTVQWSVAEFPPAVVNVQRKSVNCGDDVTPVGLSAVTMDHTFLLLSGRRANTNQSGDSARSAVLTTTTNADIRKTAGAGCGAADTHHLQVVEYTNASVQRGIASMTGETSTQVNLNSQVELNRSVLLYSYLFDSQTSNTKICDRLVRGELSNTGNLSKVTFTRGDGDTTNCSGSKLPEISWEVVQFPAGTNVYPLTRSLPAGTASLPVTLPEAVDLSRTIVIAGGQWASGQTHGESSYSGGALVSEGRITATLTGSTALTLTRTTSNASATFTVYVVQLKP